MKSVKKERCIHNSYGVLLENQVLSLLLTVWLLTNFCTSLLQIQLHLGLWAFLLPRTSNYQYSLGTSPKLIGYLYNRTWGFAWHCLKPALGLAFSAAAWKQSLLVQIFQSHPGTSFVKHTACEFSLSSGIYFSFYTFVSQHFHKKHSHPGRVWLIC